MQVGKSKSVFDGGIVMGNIIGAIVLGVIAIGCFIISYLQFNEKGFLFNNAYLYALDMILKTRWLFYVVIAIAIVTIVYAIISSIRIEIK